MARPGLTGPVGTVTLTPLTPPGRGLLSGARIYKAPPAQEAENPPSLQPGVTGTGWGCSPNLEGGRGADGRSWVRAGRTGRCRQAGEQQEMGACGVGGPHRTVPPKAREPPCLGRGVPGSIPATSAAAGTDMGTPPWAGRLRPLRLSPQECPAPQPGRPPSWGAVGQRGPPVRARAAGRHARSASQPGRVGACPPSPRAPPSHPSSHAP